MRALGAADPVTLHGQDPVRPLPLQHRHVVQQPLVEVGDPEVPLGQVAFGDLGTASFAVTADDLLVRQHRLVVRAPVDRGGLPVRQVMLVQLQEQPLRPLVVARVVAVQPGRPVEADGVTPERISLGLDVGVGPGDRVHIAFDGGVLRRQAEGVPADRVQDVVPLLEPVARHHVGQRPRLGVAHVQVAGRVRVHVQQVAALGRRRPWPGTAPGRPRPSAICPGRRGRRSPTRCRPGSPSHRDATRGPRAAASAVPRWSWSDALLVRCLLSIRSTPSAPDHGAPGHGGDMKKPLRHEGQPR